MDWEIYRNHRPMRAHLYAENVLVAIVYANGPLRLAWKMRREQKRFGVKKATALG